MFKNIAPFTFLLAFSAAASAEEQLPSLDIAKAEFNYTDGMDFEDADGTLNATSFELSSFVAKPIDISGGFKVIPQFRYRLTSLDFDGVAPSFPIADEDLHSLAMSVFALKMDDSSPWIYGGFARAEMASDFQHINGDDFTYDLAAGAGYRFNSDFIAGVGVAVINMNGDLKVFPGINFDWAVSKEIRVGLYGPNFVAAYTPSNDWSISLRGEPRGGIWNITDDGGQSHSIDFSSYQVGLFATRRIVDKLWLTAGVGTSFINEISLTEPRGEEITAEDLEGGLFYQIGLSLKTW